MSVKESGASAPRSLFSGTDDRPAATASVVVYSLRDAVAALGAAKALDRPLRLITPLCFAASLGPRVARELIDAALATIPSPRASWIIECGSDAGLAMAALRAGALVIRVDLREDVRARVADIARQQGARLALADDAGPALDLADVTDARVACLRWLSAPREAAVDAPKA